MEGCLEAMSLSDCPDVCFELMSSRRSVSCEGHDHVLDFSRSTLLPGTTDSKYTLNTVQLGRTVLGRAGGIARPV